MKQFAQYNLTNGNKTMSFSKKFRKPILACLSAVIVATSLPANSADYSKAEKELHIMSTIFQTSLNETSKDNRSNPFTRRSNSAEATYLAKQGMVFKFNFGDSHFGTAEDWQAFGEGIGNLVGTIASEVTEALSDLDGNNTRVPAPPAAPFSDQNWDSQVEAYEEYQQAMDLLRDKQRDQRQEVRDLQRSIREIERQARREEKDSKTLEKTKQKLEEKMKVLSEKMESYEKSMKEYREKKKQAAIAKNKEKSELIISTLCDYGTTLKSLKNDEYVTLIFSNFENGKDQVYVFNYKEVKSCSDSKKLAKRAISYQL